MRILNCLPLFALVCGGCVVVHDTNPNPGPQGPPLYRITPGASTVVYPGTQAGYGITANLGGSYRAVWTGDSPVSYSNFRGTIYTPGHFTNFDPGCGGVCPDEANDVFTAPGPVAGGGEQITFDTVALDGLDGLDFAVDLEPVEFTLTIDGASYPNLVFYPDADTHSITSPSEIPFDLTTN
jgi:hypothetical protein